MKEKDTKKADKLRALLDTIGDRYPGVRSSAEQLELVGLTLLTNDDRVSDYVLQQQAPLDADLREYNPGGTGDGGIDGLLFDPTRKCVSLLQSTFVKNWDESLADKARSFFAKLPEWADKTKTLASSGLNQNTQRLLRESEISLKETDIRMVFVTNLAIGSKPADKLFEIASSQTTTYQDSGYSVTCEVWGQSEILRNWDEMQNTFSHRGIEGSTSLRFKASNYFELDKPFRTIVGAISTNEIRSLFNKQNVRNVIFNANIRMALGGKNKINQGIKETLDSNPDKFFYFNNGVTATCSNYSRIENEITLENLQVVNGAQTVSTIGNSDSADDSLVLLRIIETGDRYKGKNEFPDKITKYQNTQNPVKASDFYSTDDFQEWLSKNLPDRALKYRACREFWYSHKRGWVNSKGVGVKIDMETLAKLRHSMLVNPNRAYNSPRDFWEAENYWEAFGSNGEECSAWSEDEIAEVAWGITVYQRLRDYVKEETELNKKRSTSSQNPETGYLSYLTIFATALGFQFIRYLQNLDAEVKALPFTDIMSSKDLFDKYYRVIAKIRESLTDEIFRRSQENEANPKFYLARDKEQFTQMLDTLKRKHANHTFDI